MKIRLTSTLAPRDLASKSVASAHTGHGLPSAGEFMRPNAPLPRPHCVEQRSWETLAIHLDDARRGGSIVSARLREAVDTVVAELRVGCIPWDEVYATLDAAVMGGILPPAVHPLELQLRANRNAAIVAHMHSWADMRRLAELEDPCATAD